jgi:DNA (cytosine-5)-methyltransferase 1
MEVFLKDAAKEIGVSPITLKRWLITGRVADVARDRNGWRVFTAKDIRRIKAFANERRYPPHM